MKRGSDVVAGATTWLLDWEETMHDGIRTWPHAGQLKAHLLNSIDTAGRPATLNSTEIDIAGAAVNARVG